MVFTGQKEETLNYIRNFVKTNKSIPLVRHLTTDKLIYVLKEFFSEDKKVFFFNNDENYKICDTLDKYFELIKVSNKISFNIFNKDYILVCITIHGKTLSFGFSGERDGQADYRLNSHEIPIDWLLTILEYLIIWVD